MSVTDDHGVDLSLCQVVLLSQPDILPNLSRQAVEFANQSILILSPTRRNACTETDTETVSSRLSIFSYVSTYIHSLGQSVCLGQMGHFLLVMWVRLI